jgi:hypothetical protein
MAVYVYGEQQIQTIINRAQRFRTLGCVVASTALIVTGLLLWYRPNVRVFHEPLRRWLVPLVVPIFLVPLLQMIRNRKTWRAKMRDSLSKIRVELSPGIISVGYSVGKREFSLSEVLRAEEPSLGGGLYVRTSNRYRWLLIPKQLEHYSEIKRELSQSGVPLVHTSIPPNVEEFVGCLLFMATGFVSLFGHDIRLLTANLFLSLLVSFGGLFVINSSLDSLTMPRKQWLRFGAFLPLIFAALGFLLR